MLRFLRGERDTLPLHYYWAINNLYDNGVSMQELVDFLVGLPLLIRVEDAIVTHGGVLIDNPYQPDISANVYGSLTEPMPRPSPEDGKIY